MFSFFLSSCSTFPSIFPSLNVIHSLNDFFVSYSHGNEKMFELLCAILFLMNIICFE